MYTIGQIARLCNVSTKTLRHYDAIGLFCPARVGRENGYRYYEHQQLPMLRRILVLRELGLGLELVSVLVDAGTLGDPDCLEPVLRARADEIQRELAARHELLARVENSIASLRSEGDLPNMATEPVVLKELPELKVVGVRAVCTSSDDVSALWQALAQKIQEAGRQHIGRPITLFHGSETDFDPDEGTLELVWPVEGKGEQTLPAGTFATIRVAGRDPNILNETFAALFAWANEHGHTQRGPVRGLYGVDESEHQAGGEYLSEFQMPIG